MFLDEFKRALQNYNRATTVAATPHNLIINAKNLDNLVHPV